MFDAQQRRRRQPPAGQPVITTAAGRRLVCYPASVHVFIVDSWDRFLLLRQPGQTGWETITGTLESGETVPESAIRHTKDAAGTEFLATYLGVLDTFTVAFDAKLPPFISICCLLRHRGGEVRPSSGAKGAEFRWWELSELDNIDLAAPRGRWDLLTRAVDMSRHLRDVRNPEEDERERGDPEEFP